MTCWYATAKSLQSCPTLCDPIDSSPIDSSVPGILQAKILEWVAISFSNAWKWKVKVKSLSHVWLCTTPWTVGSYQATLSVGFSRNLVGCHVLLHLLVYRNIKLAIERLLLNLKKTPGFLASGGEEFNLQPETRLDCSELFCNKVLLKYKGHRESFWHRHLKGVERVPPC